MRGKIVVIDYGMGNLRSVSKALIKAGAKVEVSSSPDEVLHADKLVVPGVGAFKDAMRELKARNLIEPIKEFIISRRPFLGLCLGLQLLFSESEEGGKTKGLGIIKGRVVKFKGGDLKIPHMGWNRLKVTSHKSQVTGVCPLFKGIPDDSYMYFVHSYYAKPNDEGCVAAWTDYGVRFPSAIWLDNIYATQFHPEKSQEIGLKMLRNFTKI